MIRTKCVGVCVKDNTCFHLHAYTLNCQDYKINITNLFCISYDAIITLHRMVKLEKYYHYCSIFRWHDYVVPKRSGHRGVILDYSQIYKILEFNTHVHCSPKKNIHIINCNKDNCKMYKGPVIFCFLMQKRHTTHDIVMLVQRLPNYDYKPYEYLAENASTSI